MFFLPPPPRFLRFSCRGFRWWCSSGAVSSPGLARDLPEMAQCLWSVLEKNPTQTQGPDQVPEKPSCEATFLLFQRNPFLVFSLKLGFFLERAPFGGSFREECRVAHLFLSRKDGDQCYSRQIVSAAGGRREFFDYMDLCHEIAGTSQI